MKSVPFGKFALAGCSLALLVSCGDSTAPIDPEVNAAFEQLTLANNLAAAGAPMGAVVVPSMGMSSACQFQAATKRFVCPTQKSQAFTMDRYYQLLDASGAPQSGWGSNVVALRTVADLGGSMNLTVPPRPPVTLTIAMHDESTLSGLKEERQTLNGLATQTVTSAEGASTSMMTRTTTNLVLPKKGEQYPQSGSIATSMGSGLSLISTTMTFNGTSTVTLTTVMFGTTKTCTMNLAALSPAFCP